jgi:C4-dicarboxylate transporter DctM subunit
VSDIWIGIFAIVASMGLVAMRVHIGAAFGIVAIIAFAYLLNWRAALSMASSVPFPLVGDWNMTAIPMFLLMGFIGSTTKLTESFDVGRKTRGACRGAGYLVNPTATL